MGLEVRRVAALRTWIMARRGDVVFSGVSVYVLSLDQGLTGMLINTTFIQHHVPEMLNSVSDK